MRGLKLVLGYVEFEHGCQENISEPGIKIKLDRKLTVKEKRMLSYCSRNIIGYLDGDEDYYIPLYELSKDNIKMKVEEIKEVINFLDEFMENPKKVFDKTIEKKKALIEDINKYAEEILNIVSMEIPKRNIKLIKGMFKVESECDIAEESPEIRISLQRKLSPREVEILDNITKIAEILHFTVDEEESDYVAFTLSAYILKNENDRKEFTEKVKNDIITINKFLRDSKKTLEEYIEKEKKEMQKMNKLAIEAFSLLTEELSEEL